MKKYLVVIITFITVIGVNAEVLSYGEYIEKIKKKLPEIKKNIVNNKLKKNEINKAKAIDDILFESSLNYMKEVGYQDYDKMNNISLNTKLSKKIKKYGISVYSSFSYNRSDVEGSQTQMTGLDPATSQPIFQEVDYEKEQYSPSIEIGFVQPFLKNAKGIIDKFPEKNAEICYEIEKEKTELNNKMIMIYYKKLYFKWIFQVKKIELIKETIENAKKIKNNVYKKYRAGLVDKDDYNSAQSMVINYQKQLILEKMNLDIIKNEIKVYISLNNVKPDSNSFNKYFQKSCDTICEKKSKNEKVFYPETTGYKIFEKTLEKLGILKKVNLNKKEAKLDLMGSINMKSGEDSFGDSIKNMDDIDYKIGISYSFPINNTKAKTEYIETELNIEKLKHEIEISKNSFEKSKKILYEQVETKDRILELINKNINTLSSKYQTQKRKYEQARLNLQFMLDTENNITSEKINKIETKMNIIMIYFDYKKLIY